MDELESILWKTKRTTDYSYRKKYSHLINAAKQVNDNKTSFDELVLPSVSMMTLKHRSTKHGLHHHRDGSYGNKFNRGFHESCSNKMTGNVNQDEIYMVKHGIEKSEIGHSFLSNRNYGNHGYGQLGCRQNVLSNKSYDTNGYERPDYIQIYGNRNCYRNLIDNTKHHSNRYYGNKMDDQKYFSDRINPMPIDIKGQRFRSHEKEMVVKYRLEKEKEQQDDKSLLKHETTFRTKSRRRTELANKELNDRLEKRGVFLPSPPLITKCMPNEERERQKFRPMDIHESYKTLKEFEEKRCCRVDDTKPTEGDATGIRAKRYVHVYLCCCKDG